jgi:inner membrane protein
MRLATHAAFGAALTLGVASITELQITPAALGLAVLSSALPELDHEGSEIGSLFPFISRRLSRRFGHRTVTHSFVGLGAFGLVISPLLIFFPELWWACVLGYFSHILLDVFTPKGVLWFWPSLVPAGFGQARVRVGSAGESVMLVVFIALSFLIYPISNVGALGALRGAIGQIEMTFEEYRRMVGEGQQVYLSGSLQENRTKEILRGKWPIVDLQGEGYLIRVGQALRTVGRSPEYDLYPLSVRLTSSYTHSPSTEGPVAFAGPLTPLRFFVASYEDLYIQEGDQVEIGQLLGLKEPDPAAETVEELLRSREVRSPISGVIRRLAIEAQEKGLRVEALVEVLGNQWC